MALVGAATNDDTFFDAFGKNDIMFNITTTITTKHNIDHKSICAILVFIRFFRIDRKNNSR